MRADAPAMGAPRCLWHCVHALGACIYLLQHPSWCLSLVRTQHSASVLLYSVVPNKYKHDFSTTRVFPTSIFIIHNLGQCHHCTSHQIMPVAMLLQVRMHVQVGDTALHRNALCKLYQHINTQTVPCVRGAPRMPANGASSRSLLRLKPLRVSASESSESETTTQQPADDVSPVKRVLPVRGLTTPSRCTLDHPHSGAATQNRTRQGRPTSLPLRYACCVCLAYMIHQPPSPTAQDLRAGLCTRHHRRPEQPDCCVWRRLCRVCSHRCRARHPQPKGRRRCVWRCFVNTVERTQAVLHIDTMPTDDVYVAGQYKALTEYKAAFAAELKPAAATVSAPALTE